MYGGLEAKQYAHWGGKQKMINEMLTEARADLRRRVTAWRKIDFSKAVPITSIPDSSKWHGHALTPGAQVRTIRRTPAGAIVLVEVSWERSGWTDEHYHPGRVETIRVTRGHLRLFVDMPEGKEEVELSPRSTPYCIPDGVAHCTFAYRDTVYEALFHPPIDSE